MVTGVTSLSDLCTLADFEEFKRVSWRRYICDCVLLYSSSGSWTTSFWCEVTVELFCIVLKKPSFYGEMRV